LYINAPKGPKSQ